MRLVVVGLLVCAFIFLAGCGVSQEAYAAVKDVFCKPFFPVFANFPCNNPAREFMRSLSSMIS
jgi:hypothetical protein